jgi:hypothetical protein
MKAKARGHHDAIIQVVIPSLDSPRSAKDSQQRREDHRESFVQGTQFVPVSYLALPKRLSKSPPFQPLRDPVASRPTSPMQSLILGMKDTTPA